MLNALIIIGLSIFLFWLTLKIGLWYVLLIMEPPGSRGHFLRWIKKNPYKSLSQYPHE